MKKRRAIPLWAGVLCLCLGLFGAALAISGLTTGLPLPAAGGTCGPGQGSEPALYAILDPVTIGAGPKPPATDAASRTEWSEFVDECQTASDNRALSTFPVLAVSLGLFVFGLIVTWRRGRERRRRAQTDREMQPAYWPPIYGQPMYAGPYGPQPAYMGPPGYPGYPGQPVYGGQPAFGGAQPSVAQAPHPFPPPATEQIGHPEDLPPSEQPPPVAERPVAERPVAERPVAEQPVAEQPSGETTGAPVELGAVTEPTGEPGSGTDGRSSEPDHDG